MPGLIFALIATFAAGLGARDQILVAMLADRRGQRPMALVIAGVCAVATAALAAALAQAVIPILSGDARQFYAALALGLSGIEMLIARKRDLPNEPTDSLGAFAIVLFAQQLTDAARFLIFAIAVGVGFPLAAGMGGAIGGIGVVALGWMGAGELLRRNLVPARRTLGAVALALAVWLGVGATSLL